MIKCVTLVGGMATNNKAGKFILFQLVLDYIRLMHGGLNTVDLSYVPTLSEKRRALMRELGFFEAIS